MKLACSQSVKCLEIALLRGSECSAPWSSHKTEQFGNDGGL